MRRLGRDTLLYGLSGVLGRAVSVVMLPVYTRYLTPAEYGLLALLDVAVEVAFIVFIAGTRAGMLRFYYRAGSDEERRAIVFTTFALEISLAAAGAIALALAAGPVWRLVLVREGSVELVRIAALNFLLGALAFTPFTLLQTERRAAAFASAQIAKLVLQVGANVVFLVVLGMGVRGMLLSSTFVNAVVGLALAAWLVRRTGIRLSWRAFRDLRRFGVPYQVTTAGAFILTFGDRFFLQRYRGAADVGLYGLAYQFGFLLYHLGAAPFLRAWDPVRFQDASRPVHERELHPEGGFFWLNVLVLTMATGIALFVRPAMTILTTAAFHDAARLVPVVLAAYVVHCWVEAMKFGIDVTEQTRYYTYASWLAVGVVVALYALLIPPFGAMGAAVATLAAFLARLGLTVFWSHRLWPVVYGWPRVLRLAALAAVVSMAGIVLEAPGLASQMAVGLGGIAIYAAVAWVVVLRAADRSALRTVIEVRSLRGLLR